VKDLSPIVNIKWFRYSSDSMSKSNPVTDFSLVATGDSLIFHRISVFEEKEFLEVRDLIKSSDASFTNFETVIPGDGRPRFKRDPTTWLRSPPYVIGELKWMGFNLFSLANNHSMDYSEGGLLETIKLFDSAGLAHAGTGATLSEAQEATYLNTEKGRVALIGINTGDEDGPAGDPWGGIPGRPGLNPLRFKTTIHLGEEEFQDFAMICDKLGLSREEGRVIFFDWEVLRDEFNEVVTNPNKVDVERTLASIRKAKDNSDYLLLSIHNHVKRRPGRTYFDDTIEYISGFVEEFSRRAIDEGVDAVLGHGTHTLNGIEIYKDRPIFYGLGNFIDQPYRSNPQPYDWFESRNILNIADIDKNPSIRLALTEEEEKRRRTTSVLAWMDFKDKEIERILLHPIELKKDRVNGRPLLVEGENAEEILGRLSRLSKEYGTHIRIKDDIGIIEL
jgi:poly-gamma-glutamate synthesis protein (capsule biosynthesis protein)